MPNLNQNIRKIEQLLIKFQDQQALNEHLKKSVSFQNQSEWKVYKKVKLDT